MEEIEKALIVDIDRADKKNVLAAVEYIDDIHAYYKKIEVRNIFQHHRTFCRSFFKLICWDRI